MTEKINYNNAIELVLTPSFLTNYYEKVFTYKKNKTLPPKTQKKRPYPLKNEAMKYFKQKKTNPFIQMPIKENYQQTPKISLPKFSTIEDSEKTKNVKGN